MTTFLLRRFIPDYQNTADPAVRAKYGRLAGIVGIICNVLLFAGKLLAGAISGSVSSRRTPSTTCPTRRVLL